jgi:glyoxylase-like metal-dependent hydrolase (beta-lactamase superfamily II)
VDQYLCVTCGTQYPASDAPPAHCPICEDDRQYIGPDGQQWTTLAALRGDHHNSFTEVAPGITAIRTAPEFAIAQHAQLIQTPAGNVLWDCVSLVDEATVSEVKQRGGLVAIAISHPHFYSSMGDWSQAFGGVPILLHASNRPWVLRPDDAIQFWEGATHDVLPGATLIRCGGHFPGSAVLHWAAGAEGRGALFTGDTIMVVPDRRYVSFMYSYPNLIPLDEASVRAIAAAVEPYAFERIHGSWPGRIVQRNGNQAVRDSAARYIAHLRGEATS